MILPNQVENFKSILNTFDFFQMGQGVKFANLIFDPQRFHPLARNVPDSMRRQWEAGHPVRPKANSIT